MTAARRWPNEDAYQTEISTLAAGYGLPLALLKGLIATESGFDPTARRVEAARDSLPPTADHPAGGDESRGLMQILVRNARALGYRGAIAGLDVPSVNLALGTRLLANNLRRARSLLPKASVDVQLSAALAAYNGGWRGNMAPPFRNQAYVDRVRRNAQYFETRPAPRAAVPAPPSFTDVETGGSSTAKTLKPLFVLRPSANPDPAPGGSSSGQAPLVLLLLLTALLAAAGGGARFFRL